ncbi:MAG: citrate synthase [Spirochaetes bacterium]|nr:citrate synthase [Spirochaetota bacterium]
MSNNLDKAEINYQGKTSQFNIIKSSEGANAIDISGLRDKTGLITYDPGFQCSSAYKSKITHIDGQKGILRYRGIPIEELAEKSSFVETAFLLIYGYLPTNDQLNLFSNRLTEHSILHEDMKNFISYIQQHAHPMPILSTMVSTLSIFYSDVFDLEAREEKISDFDVNIVRLISKIRTIAAFAYKKSCGEPFVYPRHDLSYCANFLNMMFSSPVKPYAIDDEVVKILNAVLILHADHGQNCSTSTVRLVGSSQVNLFSAVCAGICALWGPLHGGANQKVIEMLADITKSGKSIQKIIDEAKDKNQPFRLMGFGHRVYKTYDPRAKMIKKICIDFLNKKSIADPILETALKLEEAALKDDYFIEKRLYPNVDFYSGIVYRALGIPTNMFTVMFAIGRLPGWIAHWKEMNETIPHKIGRPSQIYLGDGLKHFIPMDERKILI